VILTQVLQRVLVPARPPRDPQDETGVSAFDNAISAVSNTIGGWLTAS
jgi:hypothetical protein